jgi:DNA-binding MarR family transcriptional regulator
MSSPTRSSSTRTADAARTEALLELPCACANVRRLSRLVTRLYDAELRDSDLEVTQFGVLSALNRMGHATHTQLARGFGMDSSTVTRVVAVLERRGWVARRAGADRRQRIYEITAAGRHQLDAARAGWRRAQQRVSTVLGADTLAALTEATAKMSAVTSGAYQLIR